MHTIFLSSDLTDREGLREVLTDLAEAGVNVDDLLDRGLRIKEDPILRELERIGNSIRCIYFLLSGKKKRACSFAI